MKPIKIVLGLAFFQALGKSVELDTNNLTARATVDRLNALPNGTRTYERIQFISARLGAVHVEERGKQTSKFVIYLQIFDPAEGSHAMAICLSQWRQQFKKGNDAPLLNYNGFPEVSSASAGSAMAVHQAAAAPA